MSSILVPIFGLGNVLFLCWYLAEQTEYHYFIKNLDALILGANAGMYKHRKLMKSMSTATEKLDHASN